MEAKHAAAREIALALGVPPMLVGIPGDNTYSNYQEAQREPAAAKGLVNREPEPHFRLSMEDRMSRQRWKKRARGTEAPAEVSCFYRVIFLELKYG